MMEFNKDGSLKIPSNLNNYLGRKSQTNNASCNLSNNDYLFILKSLDELPFKVGKKLLIDFVRGIDSNDSISRNKLFRLVNFGSLAYGEAEVETIIDCLEKKKLIEYVALPNNKYIKVLTLTSRGEQEIIEPGKFYKNFGDENLDFIHKKTIITDQDKKIFESFGDFLEKFNDEQKKAIISNNDKILCVAGAGSGKTTVLTKRIEFLCKFKSIKENKILAITFTRKARKEMRERLKKIGNLDNVNVETFNSFCEKFLRKNSEKIYDKPMKVIEYKDKILMVNKALSVLGTDISNAILTYFTMSQRKLKTKEQLANIFMNDCFFVRDYMKSKNQKLELEMFDVDSKHKNSAKLVFGVCNFIDAYMSRNGIRDFTDQLLDTIKVLKENKDLIPNYDYILIDEYQDVNATQIELIDILNSENLFCVGDPRQSIYGWRGSDIKYILNFTDKYRDCEIISLVKNYRSGEKIVNLFNCSIKEMKLPDIEFANNNIKKEDVDIRLLSFESSNLENVFIINSIKNLDIDRKEVFVLARTNKQLVELSELMKEYSIEHTIRSDEFKKVKDEDVKGVTLATIHAIKGLEAEVVFIMGCNKQNFPCRGSEHPIIEMIKIDEYDKLEEEKRLFYVAISRAKKKLFLTYTGSVTYFITPSMLKIIHEKNSNMKDSESLVKKLKKWRLETSNDLGVPAFMIMNDKTLIEIATKEPMVLEELQMVNGVGPNTIKRFGNIILDIVNNKL